MKKRYLAFMLALTLLAGCGAPGASSAKVSSGQEESAQASAATETPAPILEPSAEASSAEEAPTVPEIPAVEYPLTDEPVTFSLWYSFPGDLSDIMQTYLADGQNRVLQFAEEKTGVNLSFMLQSVTTANDNFNLLVASGDYPDMFQNASSYYTGGMDKAVQDEVLLELTDLIPEYAPNYNALIHSDNATLASVSTSTGKKVEVCRILADYVKPSTGLVVRQDWLDDLNLEVPVTLDDFHDMLVAFKDQKGAVEPLGLGYTGILDGNEICSAFDVNGVYAAFMGSYPFYAIDDQVKFGWAEDNFTEYLTLMNQWYSEGLIGKDFYTQNTGHGIDTSKTTTGQCGVWLHDYFQMELVESQMAEEGANIQAIAAPVKEAGQTLHFDGKKTLNGGFGWAITTDCKQPELALQYTDFFFTEEGSTLCNYGVEGEGMEYDAQGMPQYTELVYANPDHSMRETQVMYTLTIGPFVEVETRGDLAYSEKAIAARDIWNTNIDDAYSMPDVELSAEQAAEFAGIMGDLMTYASGKITEFIIGADSLDNWDQYIDQLKSFQVDRVVEIYQDVYNVYMA